MDLAGGGADLVRRSSVGSAATRARSLVFGTHIHTHTHTRAHTHKHTNTQTPKHTQTHTEAHLCKKRGLGVGVAEGVNVPPDAGAHTKLVHEEPVRVCVRVCTSVCAYVCTRVCMCMWVRWVGVGVGECTKRTSTHPHAHTDIRIGNTPLQTHTHTHAQRERDVWSTLHTQRARYREREMFGLQ